ncbi:hypothetical protein MANES_14G166600v8 [Manihot esculenta]|uniref:Endoplasmic reticulum vesicle transporter C-terminal domain-containing protein n=2 Tax=Manihot esculenta TaxID=3983 RepID=A0A2C9UM94_MANES|nr:hypothetical protein MANES_14G166600v8 [Manihot esculenta]
MIQKLKKLDAYPKISEDFYRRTFSGGLITLFSFLIMLFLFISEFRLYMHTVTETKLLVDTSRGETVKINFDLTFHAIPCSLISLDAKDTMGEEHFDITHDITKRRINADGNVIEVTQSRIGAHRVENPLQKHGGRLKYGEIYCGSCYGAEQSDEQCCNSCEQLRDAYIKKGWAARNLDETDQCKRERFFDKVVDQQGEGCNIYGSLEVNKVAGNFHFVPGKGFHHSDVKVHDLLSVNLYTYNISHKINRLALGDYFPGVVNPLDGVHREQGKPNGLHQYLLMAVPTIYTDIKGEIIKTNQYSVTEHHHLESANYDAPGVFFIYDFYPIKVTFKEDHIPFLHFVTSICAVFGGIFTIAGILDSFIYHGQRAIKKKAEIGKYT